MATVSASADFAQPATDAYDPLQDNEYMGPAMLGYFRKVLEEKRREILANNEGFKAEFKDEFEAARQPDLLDRGAAASSFFLTRKQSEKSRSHLRMVEGALERIESGDYGYCIDTGEEIGVGRLMAHPWAKRTVEAQERADKGLGPIDQHGRGIVGAARPFR